MIFNAEYLAPERLNSFSAAACGRGKQGGAQGELYAIGAKIYKILERH
jgi:hypothetical protein